MNSMIMYALVAMVAFFFYQAWMRFFGGTRILVERYDLIDDEVVRVNPAKCSIAMIKRVAGIDKLVLPRKWAKKTIEPPKHSDMILNDKGKRYLKILKVNEDEFQIMKLCTKIDGKNINTTFKIIQRDVSFWATNETKRLESEHKQESKWDKIKPLVTYAVVGMICLMMIVVSINKAGDIMNQASDVNRDTKNFLERFANDPNKYIVAGQALANGGVSEETPTDAAAPPTR